MCVCLYTHMKMHSSCFVKRLEVLTAVNIKGVVFQDKMFWSSIDRYQCFGESCCLHLLSWRWRQQVPPTSCLILCKYYNQFFMVEDYYLLRHDAMKSHTKLAMFQKNDCTTFTFTATILSLSTLHFYPKVAYSTLLWNMNKYLTDYMVSHPWRQ
jgi:hypothetical protein